MKRTAIHYHLAAIVIAAAMSIVSCRKSPLNPEVESLPAAEFALSAVETRMTEVEFPWSISKTGKTNSLNEDLDDMYVTQYNKVTLSVRGTGSGYKGVNVESSNPNTVQVHELSAGSYVLVYIADGEADISVWNGGKNDEIRTTFHVTAKGAIYPTAAIFILDEGTENEKEIKLTEWFIDEKTEFFRYYATFINVHKPLDYRDLYKTNAFDVFINAKEGQLEYPPKYMHVIRFKRIEPENTSFRTLVFNCTKYKEVAAPEWKQYLQDSGLTTDWWDSWTGDYQDFDKTCYFAKVGIWGLPDFSLCEITLKVNSPAGSSWCQTAMIMKSRSSW